MNNNPTKIKPSLLLAFLNSLKDPFLFADTNHIIQYMNKAAIEHYKEGISLIGRSLLDCHNQKSGEIIEDIMRKFQQSTEDECLITDNSRHRIFMRAVRNSEGTLLGYYERYEPPGLTATIQDE